MAVGSFVVMERLFFLVCSLYYLKIEKILHYEYVQILNVMMGYVV